jgi:cytochrome P450
VSVTVRTPHADLDLFSDEVIEDPYPHFRRLRDAGPAVWLESSGAWALLRYDVVRAALKNWQTFTSESGVFISDDYNAQSVGEAVITSVPPQHKRLRRVLSSRLAPPALRDVRGMVEERADKLVSELVARGSFDAVTDFGEPFPLHLMSDLIGVPEEGRDHFVEWARASFNLVGPPNERAQQGERSIEEVRAYVVEYAKPECLTPGSFGRTVFEARDRGDVTEREATWLVMVYLLAGIDATVHAFGNAIWIFANHPDQWDIVRSDEQLVAPAFEEAMRFEGPVLYFARTLTTDFELDGITLHAGDKALVGYASANRDERHWVDPDVVDVRRNAASHLSFGYGLHTCAGQGLARVEAAALFTALGRRVRRFHLVGTPVRHFNNAVRGFESLPVEVELA